MGYDFLSQLKNRREQIAAQAKGNTLGGQVEQLGYGISDAVGQAPMAALGAFLTSGLSPLAMGGAANLGATSKNLMAALTGGVGAIGSKGTPGQGFMSGVKSQGLSEIANWKKDLETEKTLKMGEKFKLDPQSYSSKGGLVLGLGQAKIESALEKEKLKLNTASIYNKAKNALADDLLSMEALAEKDPSLQTRDDIISQIKEFEKGISTSKAFKALTSVQKSDLSSIIRKAKNNINKKFKIGEGIFGEAINKPGKGFFGGTKAGTFEGF